MKMRMERESLAPRVEYGEKTEHDPEMARVAADHEQSLTHGPEQDVVETARVSKGERVEQIWNGEDDMKVRNGEQLALTLLEPTSACLELTTGAVAVATRVPGDLAIVALGTAVEMSAEGRSLTLGNGAEYATLWSSQRAAGFELRPNLADDLTE